MNEKTLILLILGKSALGKPIRKARKTLRTIKKINDNINNLKRQL